MGTFLYGLLDGSHALAVRRGEAFRKRHKTTNALYLTDRQGTPLILSGPVIENHYDLYVIKVQA